MESYRLSRSEMGSENDSVNTVGCPDILLKKYKKYKSLCKDLLCEVDELKQKEETSNRKLSLEVLRVGELETENLQLTKRIHELEQLLETQKRDYTIKIDALNKHTMQLEEEKKDVELVRKLNDNLGQEVVSLTLKTQELSLSKNAAERLISQMQKQGSTLVDKECSSWWCPKHSKLAAIHKNLTFSSLVEKTEVTMALRRQKYWSQNNEIRCCVYDRKTGTDRHSTPPQCWVKYMATHRTSSISMEAVFKNCEDIQNIISSDSDS